MKFTHDELISIENTMEKLYSVTRAMTKSDSTDTANARALCFIISNMRLSADLIEQGQVSAGHQRTIELFATNN
jgi:hypothetical protein